ncbi:max-like protein X [Rhopilema esculentum]|uniref:max-like protein X n=1 Tax=Rhopilema esculentum TaxID=499914 RepID=UPI0031D41CBE|eukprot:gene1330-15728_t
MDIDNSSMYDTDDGLDDCSPGRKQGKQSHILAEQKRRDAIRRGFEGLQEAVPGCGIAEDLKYYKMSKAQILQRSLNHINTLLLEKQIQDEELQALEKEMKALEIMKENYEQLVKASQPELENKNEVTEDEKLAVFLKVSGFMWDSFREVVSVSSFQALSSSLFGWLEKYCKPQPLNDTVVNSMRSTFAER